MSFLPFNLSLLCSIKNRYSLTVLMPSMLSLVAFFLWIIYAQEIALGFGIPLESIETELWLMVVAIFAFFLLMMLVPAVAYLLGWVLNFLFLWLILRWPQNAMSDLIWHSKIPDHWVLSDEERHTIHRLYMEKWAVRRQRGRLRYMVVYCIVFSWIIPFSTFCVQLILDHQTIFPQGYELFRLIGFSVGFGFWFAWFNWDTLEKRYKAYQRAQNESNC